MKDKLSLILIIGILFSVGGTVYFNYSEQKSIDRSKLPEKVEQSRGFQRWITNLKNNDLTVEADEFTLIEENEIYNTKNMVVYSMDQEGVPEQFNNTINSMKDVDDVVFSPSERQFIDYRHEIRGPNLEYKENDAHYYGLREDKVIDAKILDCPGRANCYFDRAYFLDNDVFVISEFSRNIKEEDDSPVCLTTQVCTYTIKIHVIDLNRNSRLVYESEPFELVLADLIPEF